MPSDKSDVDPINSPGFEQATNCKYYSFDNPQNLDSKIEKFETTKCGFNQDGNFYCPMHRGDSLYTEFKNNYVSQLNKAKSKCHVYSLGLWYENN